MPARGVVDALRERGVSVPEDAVVGLGNWDVIAVATPPRDDRYEPGDALSAGFAHQTAADVTGRAAQ